MQQAWLCFVLFICALELFSSGGFSHSLVLLGILLLKAQADYAANRWLKCKDVIQLARSWAAENLTNKTNPSEGKPNGLPPFQKPRSPEPISLEEAKRRREEAEKTIKSEPKKEHPSPAPKTAQGPNFSGKPHEVLLIEPQSPTGQIIHAFRYWMKVYHPDHCPNQKDANEKARKIQEAKELMLENRRRLRKSA